VCSTTLDKSIEALHSSDFELINRLHMVMYKSPIGVFWDDFARALGGYDAGQWTTALVASAHFGVSYRQVQLLLNPVRPPEELRRVVGILRPLTHVCTLRKIS
jgi:hypothetical protein